MMLAQRLLSDQIYSARTLTWVNVSRLDGPVGNARTSSDRPIGLPDFLLGPPSPNMAAVGLVRRLLRAAT